MTDWRRSRPVAVLVIAMFLAIQLAVPISRLGDESAKRFGWQMFSEGSTLPVFVVHTDDVSDVEISLDDYTAMVRADIDLVDLIPPHLCAVVPGAALVTWQTGDYQC